MKENRGITLIALVVTIIILLILAGVSITTLSGNGLFGRAQSGAAKYQEASRAENSTITSLMDKYDNYEESVSGQYELVLENLNGWKMYYLKDKNGNIVGISDAYVVSSKGKVNIFNNLTVCQNMDRDRRENIPGDRIGICERYLITHEDAVMYNENNTIVVVKDGKEYSANLYVAAPNANLEAEYSVNNGCYFLEIAEWRDNVLAAHYRYNKIYVVIDGSRVDISDQIVHDLEMGYSVCVKYGEITVNGQPLEGTYEFIAVKGGIEYSTTYTISNPNNVAVC